MMNRGIGGLQDMYSRNCGKSRTNTNHANVIRHYQHAGEQEGWEFRSCVTSRFNQTLDATRFARGTRKYRHDSVYPDCFGLKDHSAIYCIS
jgi:hypothetical protein